ncbi:MAG: TRAP transporter substrate-binding protein DctP [Spirochaetales bacterium]|jgi:TRAP-type C4-dicarboxylate transport system substrate-binding protein|nr:TRAP transporter substrate-binding protein DctP [Spirochaetales bacterium]
MKNRFFIGGLVLLIIVSMGLWAGGQNEGSGKAKVLKLGINTPEDSVRGAMAKVFKEEVEKNTQGRYVIDFFFGESLGSEPEQVEGVKIGSQDFTIAGATLLGTMDPAFNAMTLPFMVSSFDDAHTKLDGAIGKAWDAKAIAHGH